MKTIPFTLKALPAVALFTASVVALADSSTATAVVGTSVAGRAPIGVAETFPADVGALVCFSEVHGGGGSVVHAWFFGDKEVFSIKLPVRGERWRTWSEKRIPASATGAWRVEVRTEQGEVLATAPFTIE